MHISKLFSTFGIICIVLAFVFLWQRNNPKRVMFLSTPSQIEVKSLVKKNLPIRLIIKNLNIDLEIFPAKVNKQRWDTTTLGVSWLDFSPVPGEKGNSILYGHNWTNILGKLTEIKPGRKIQIILRDGSEQTFFVENTAVVSPKNASVLKQTSNQRITLYTCVGLFDQKRFVV